MDVAGDMKENISVNLPEEKAYFKDMSKQERFANSTNFTIELPKIRFEYKNFCEDSDDSDVSPPVSSTLSYQHRARYQNWNRNIAAE